MAEAICSEPEPKIKHPNLAIDPTFLVHSEPATPPDVPLMIPVPTVPGLVFSSTLPLPALSLESSHPFLFDNNHLLTIFQNAATQAAMQAFTAMQHIHQLSTMQHIHQLQLGNVDPSAFSQQMRALTTHQAIEEGFPHASAPRVMKANDVVFRVRGQS